jgi:DNA-3-methyladenine glycosylase
MSLEISFFERPTEEVAKDLLGQLLCHEMDGSRLSGRIVETEAYLDESDLASHAAWSKRGRLIMHGPPGRVYMYRAYGIHFMFNVVTEQKGKAGAVLIRALEPRTGIVEMQRRRALTCLSELCSGPGKLCQAMGFDLSTNGVDLTNSRSVWIEQGVSSESVHVSRRIGITKNPEPQLRFFDPTSPHVSVSPVTAEPKLRPSSAD